MELQHKAVIIAVLRQFQEVVEANPRGYHKEFSSDMRAMLTNMGEFKLPDSQLIDEIVEAVKQG